MMAFNCNHITLRQAYIFKRKIFDNTIPISSFKVWSVRIAKHAGRLAKIEQYILE